MPAPAGSCCKDNEGAATADHEIVVGVVFFVDGTVEYGVGIMRTARVRHALRGQRRYNVGIRTYREAAEDREAKHREVDLGSIIHPAWPVG